MIVWKLKTFKEEEIKENYSENKPESNNKNLNEIIEEKKVIENSDKNENHENKNIVSIINELQNLVWKIKLFFIKVKKKF